MFSLEREDSLMKAFHKKTGKTYYIDDVVIDTTNELDLEKQVKILYHDDEAKKFVREADEFFEKFEIEQGFNVLSKACELIFKEVEKFHNRCCIIPQPLGTPVSCSCGGNCSCNNEKEYIGEMIRPEVFKTYTQLSEKRWYVPLSIVRTYAYTQLKELFNIRCSEFDIVKKEYDNATDEYFLLGYRNDNDFPKEPAQVCKIPQEVFECIHSAIMDREFDILEGEV